MSDHPRDRRGRRRRHPALDRRPSASPPPRPSPTSRRSTSSRWPRSPAADGDRGRRRRRRRPRRRSRPGRRPAEPSAPASCTPSPTASRSAIEDLAIVETHDNGALLRSHRRGVMPRVAHNFRFFADFAGTSSATPTSRPRGHRNHVSWDPAGVVAVITPWNAPLMLATWKIAPALAAGNTVVAQAAGVVPAHRVACSPTSPPRQGCRPASSTSSRAPAPRPGPRSSRTRTSAGSRFTGSVPTAGVDRRRPPRANLTPLSLRARRQVAAAGLRRRRPRPRRRPRRRAVRQRRTGVPGRHPHPRRGLASPTSSPGASSSARRQLRAGRPARRRPPTSRRRSSTPPFGAARRLRATARSPTGARAVIGGGPNDELGGLYYRPTLLADAAQDSEIVTEEVFGPVLTLQTFGTEDEAVAIANDTHFGLAATIVTGDRDRAERVSARGSSPARSGSTASSSATCGAPFGGSRHSGIGREGGTWSFDFYCDVKNTRVRPGWMADTKEGFLMGEVVGAGLLAHVPTIVLPEEARRELNDGKDITLVTGLQQLRREVFDVARLRHRRRPRLPLGDHRRVRRHRPGPPAGPVHLRGAAARDVTAAVRLPGRPRTRPPHRGKADRARHLDHRASTTPTCRSTTPPSTCGSSSARACPTSGGSRIGVCQTADMRGPPAARPRAGRRHRRSPTARCC